VPHKNMKLMKVREKV